MQTHNILQLFEMPQIGYSATAKQLSDKEKFKYFTRVIASDTQQAQAIVDIIRQFNWNYVATIGTEGRHDRSILAQLDRNRLLSGDYGRGGVEAIRRLLKNDACIGADYTMVTKSVTPVSRNDSSFPRSLAHRCEYHSGDRSDSTTRRARSTRSSVDLLLSRSLHPCRSSSHE